MFGFLRKEAPAPAQYEHTKRTNGLLILLSEIGYITNPQIDVLAKQVILDMGTGDFRSLAEITKTVGITNGSLPKDSFLPLLCLNYTEQAGDNPLSSVADRMRADLAKLTTKGDITVSEDQFTINEKGLTSASEALTAIRAKLASIK